MFKNLRYRTVVTLGLVGVVFAIYVSGFGLSQAGSKSTRADRKKDTAIEVSASQTLVMLPPRTADPRLLNCELTESEVKLLANATSPHKTDLNFTWEVPVGHLIGKGREVTWDLSGAQEGTYSATVEASDKQKHTARSSLEVTVVICPGWHPDPPPCPSVSVSCPSGIEPKASATFEASMLGDFPRVTYEWSVSAGKIISGQATSKIAVDVSGLSDESVTATVAVGGVDPLCQTVASCTIYLTKTKLQ
jgi:hypothetical protein